MSSHLNHIVDRILWCILGYIFLLKNELTDMFFRLYVNSAWYVIQGYLAGGNPPKKIEITTQILKS